MPKHLPGFSIQKRAPVDKGSSTILATAQFEASYTLKNYCVKETSSTTTAGTRFPGKPGLFLDQGFEELGLDLGMTAHGSGTKALLQFLYVRRIPQLSNFIETRFPGAPNLCLDLGSEDLP